MSSSPIGASSSTTCQSTWKEPRRRTASTRSAKHVIHAPGQAREHERREVPDRFFRTQFPKAAAGEAAPDREHRRDDLAVRERRQADEHADGDAEVRTVDQPGQKRAFEREVGGLVSQQQAGGDAGREQETQTEREHHAIGPRTVLEDQELAKSPESHDDGGRRGHDGELDEQRRQQDLHDLH